MTERRCGSCTLCCRLPPVLELEKAAGVRCKHQRTGKGCSIYRARPMGCRAWSCLWLIDPRTETLRRPDRSGYVLDCLPDYVTLPSGRKLEVVQIWCDSRGVTLEAALLAYLQARKTGAILRSSGEEAVALLPPEASPSGDWTLAQGSVRESQHTPEQIFSVLDEVRPWF